MSSLFKIAFYLLALSAACAIQAGTDPLHYRQQTLTLAGTTVTATIPAGYRLELLTDKLDAPRLMAFAPNGDLFIGSRADTIYRLQPPYTRPQVWLRTAGYPHSIAFRAGQMFVAKTDGLYAIAYAPGMTPSKTDRLRLIAALPAGFGHNSRTVAVGPDGRIYVSLGLSGNCSDQYLGAAYPFDAQRGGILVLEEGQGRLVGNPTAAGCVTPSVSTGSRSPASCTPTTTGRTIMASISRPSISVVSCPVRFTVCRGFNMTASVSSAMTASAARRHDRRIK